MDDTLKYTKNIRIRQKNGIKRTRRKDGTVLEETFVKGQKISRKVSGRATRYLSQKKEKEKPWKMTIEERTDQRELQQQKELTALQKKLIEWQKMSEKQEKEKRTSPLPPIPKKKSPLYTKQLKRMEKGR